MRNREDQKKIDQSLLDMHAAAARTVAQDLEKYGFIPEYDVTTHDVEPHEMSEQDVETFLRLLRSAPRQKQNKIVITGPVIQMPATSERFIQELNNAYAMYLLADNGLGLGLEVKSDKSDKEVEINFPLHDGRDHYEFLQVTFGQDKHAKIQLVSDLPKPSTEETATYKSLRAVERTVSEMKGFSVKSSDVEFGKPGNEFGIQEDPISCSYRTLRRLVKAAANGEEQWQDILKPSSINQLKLAVNQRLAPNVAAQLKIEDGVVCKQALTVQQSPIFQAHKKVAAEVKARKADEEKFTQRLVRAKGRRDLFGEIKNLKTLDEMKLNVKLVECSQALATVKKELTETEASIQKNNAELKYEKVPEFDFGKKALEIASDKEQVKELDAALQEIKASDLPDTKSILQQMKAVTKQLAEQSQEAVKIARKSLPVQSVNAADQITKNATKEVLASLHQTMLLYGQTFGKGEAKSEQEKEDAELARIIQDQFILEEIKRRHEQEEKDHQHALGLSRSK